ncbi:MAG: heme biosynthesis protein HemY [Burkholderiaceae bacterium]|jgi:HemY protein|nr:heme biosynthesis protein HemY [Burkholderiaceae bacterium]
MRFVVWLVVLSVVAAVAATMLGRNDGWVSLYWGGWRLEFSLNLFVLGVAATCVVLVLAMQALSSLATLPRRSREWRALRHERAAHAALREALGEYLGARYTRSNKAAQRSLAIEQARPDQHADRDLQVLAHLLSAASLHRLQDRRLRDEQMQRARALRRVGPARVGDDGALLLAAEWAVDDLDPGRALELLAELPPGVARRTQALRLRLQAQRLAAQSLEALRTARLLAKHQGFTPLAARGLLRTLALQALGDARDVDQLQRVWQQLEPADRADPHVAAHAARRAAAFGRPALARTWLKPSWEALARLDADEREQLALALIDAVEGIGTEWLPWLESALDAHPGEPALVAAAGVAFAERLLWGKAAGPLEQAARAPLLAASARRRAWRTLAVLATEQGDADRAAACERAAAALD